MKHKDLTWGWMLGVDFFFAGMGGAMLLITGIAELIPGAGKTSLPGNIIAPVFIGIGASFLILELGRPLQAWRVFLSPKAILTIGAWCMLLAIGFGLGYASFGIQSLPWSGWNVVRKILAFLCALFGLAVATYPGILLSRHKARPFWTGPGMMVLFLISSLVTGSAAHLLSWLILPPETSGLQKSLPVIVTGLLVFQLLIWPAYLWIKRSGTTQRESLAVQPWVKGEFSIQFWVGILLLGTLLPIVLTLLTGSTSQAIGAGMVMIGGLLIRLQVIRSGEYRTWLPGEEKFRSRLPHGDEAFLKAWKAK
jgi:protein NrfD